MRRQRLTFIILIGRGLAALLILEVGQCEGLNAGMGEKLESPMPFLFPYNLMFNRPKQGEWVGRNNIWCMKNSISYFAGGKKFIIPTQLTFENRTDEQIAVKVFQKVSFDRDTRLMNEEIPHSISAEELQGMTEEEKMEWSCITKIEFIDYVCRKKLSMHHMSDIQGKFKVESLEQTELL